MPDAAFAAEWRADRDSAPSVGAASCPDVRGRVLTEQDLDDLATGSWILGAGGGGDPYTAVLELKALYAQGRSCRVIDPLDLADDARVACVGKMGSPLVTQERLEDGEIITETLRMMERTVGHAFDAIMLWEIGGANCFQALLAAAHTGLPIVDCDAMGRAFPQADMTTFAICGLTPHPWTMVDIRRNRILFVEAEDWSWMERLTRQACGVLGSAVATCKAPRTGREAKTCSVLHTVSHALRIGAAVRDARSRHEDPVAALLRAGSGREIFAGKIRDVARRTTAGHLRGDLSIVGAGEWQGRDFALAFQNEFSIGWLDGEVAVTVPDLICLMDPDSGEAIGAETVRFGQAVRVVVLPAPAILLTDDGLRHVGPRAFGFDMPYHPFFGEPT